MKKNLMELKLFRQRNTFRELTENIDDNSGN
ncbi:hypothetical protein BACCAC_02414 [Bacteroides caccae ATCC 43185]|nr:hypothetical protein BACCAC_02414 [Bacteroides caccae ATCC 43185]